VVKFLNNKPAKAPAKATAKAETGNPDKQQKMILMTT
jgi:hypothetical protein